MSLAGDRVRVGHAVEYETALSSADLGQFLDIGETESPGPTTDDSMVEMGDAGQVVPGMLAGSLISTALSRLPGVAVHLSQDLSFHNPARVGSILTVECEVVENLGRDRYRLRTRVLDGDDAVVDGEALVRIDDWPET